MSLYAKRSPYPFHIVVGGQGFLLGSARPGAPMLTSTKSQDISNITPTDYSYSGMSPLEEREAPYESLVLGMGQRLQEKYQDQHYAYAQAVDLSVWPWCKGPEVNTLTPATVDNVVGVSEFFELGGVLFMANGRYVLSKAAGADTWSVAHDFGAGEAILDVAVFTSNFDGVARAFFALKTGVAQYTTTGTGAYTAMATFHALAFAVVGREFWWADDVNQLRKCDTNADPTNEANYTSLIFRAGDKSSPIVNLPISAAGTLLVFKTDGIYTLDAAGDDHQLFPFLKFAPDPSNGKHWGQFENSIYVSYGSVFVRIDSDLSMTEVGPEKLVNNDSPVRGKVTAFAGVGTMFAMAAILNPDTLTGYLMKFGSYVSQGISNSQQTLEPIHVDAWHGSLSDPFPSRAIQTLFVSAIGAPNGHTRTYLGFSDGSVGWLVNPCVPNPAACSVYRFHVGDSFVELPLWHGTYHASKKTIRHFALTGPKLDANNYVQVEYQTDPSVVGFTLFPNIFDHGTYERAPLDPVAVTILARFRVHLHNTANTASPLVSAFTIGHALRPQRIMQFEGDILCADGLVRRDGVPMRIGRKKIQQLIEQAVDEPGAVTCILPDETTQQLSFTDLRISQAFDEVGRQWRGSLRIKAVQHWTDTIEI